MEKKPSKFRELLDKYHEIIMYLIFGVATTVVSWIIYGVAIRTIGLSSGLAAAFSVTAVLLLWALGLTAARSEDVIVEPELQAAVARV